MTETNTAILSPHFEEKPIRIFDIEWANEGGGLLIGKVQFIEGHYIANGDANLSATFDIKIGCSVAVSVKEARKLLLGAALKFAARVAVSPAEMLEQNES